MPNRARTGGEGGCRSQIVRLLSSDLDRARAHFSVLYLSYLSSDAEAHTAFTGAVERGEITEPAEVTDAMLRTGASEYQTMCVPCHGTPGGSRGEFGRGMKPEPPDLAHVACEMQLREVYWVLHHGIRHTGMPAFGGTHSTEDLWAIATFVERVDEMTPAEYERWIEQAGAEHGSHKH